MLLLQGKVSLQFKILNFGYYTVCVRVDVDGTSVNGNCSLPLFLTLFTLSYAAPSLQSPSQLQPTLTLQHELELKQVFDSMDRDTDGKISINDLKQCLEQLEGREYSREMIQELITEIDNSEKGYIVWKDFIQAMAP